MRQCHLRAAVVMVLASVAAACGGVSASAVPSAVANATPTAMPSAAVRATMSAVPSVVAGTTPTAMASPSGLATATITVQPGVEADGPGTSVSEALGNAGLGPQLVNGILLKAVDGSEWLCEAVLTTSPPQCAVPRLLVERGAQEGAEFATGDGVHEADGVHWVENVQLFGVVKP